MTRRQAIDRSTAGLWGSCLARVQDTDSTFPIDDFVAGQGAHWQRVLTEAGIRVA